MNPTAGDLHVNRPLTNISVAHTQDLTTFGADVVFPSVPVEKQSDLYWLYDRADWNRNQFRIRADATESAGGGWKLSNTPYFASVWALHKDISDRQRANADDPFNLDRDSTLWLTEQAAIAREVSWASTYFTTSLWSGQTDQTGAASATTNVFVYWSSANSTPIESIASASDAVKLKSFMRPNTLAVGSQVWTALKNHAEIIDRIKYTSGNNNPAIVTRGAVAALMELDRIVVLDGVQVTSKENPVFETSITTAFIAGKNALLVYAAPRPSLLMPTGGYTFNWTGLLGAAGPFGMRIKRFRMEQLEADRIEGEMAYSQVLIDADSGAFFSGAVA